MKHTITDIVKGTRVKFDSYNSTTDKFTYSVKLEDGTNYIFDIDRSDVGNATLLSEDKALIFMRWIRKSINDDSIITALEFNEEKEYAFSNYRAGFLYYKKRGEEKEYAIDITSKGYKIFFNSEDSTLQQYFQQAQQQCQSEG